MADSKISALSAITSLAGTEEFAVANAGASNKITAANVKASLAPVGGTALVYRYTVTGSDKASIDTGVDTAQAGTNDWTNGDLLEVYFTSRSDNGGALPQYDIRFNNDSGGNYYRNFDGANNTTQQASCDLADTAVSPFTHGSGGSSTFPGVTTMRIPGYAGTAFAKICELVNAVPDGSAGNNQIGTWSFTWNNTAALTRIKVASEGTDKFKVGTQLLIYKRLAS